MRLSNESYFSLNFIARKRQNKEGELPISLRITMNGQTCGDLYQQVCKTR